MLVRTPSDLSSVLSAVKDDVLILDFETSSGHRRKDSLNVHFNCRIAGTGVTSPKCAENGIGFYIPTGHTTANSIDGIQNRASEQLPPYAAAHLLYDLIKNCKTIVGHNIKYDLHVLVNNWSHYFPFMEEINNKRVLDTLTHAKLTESDRWSYGLKKLSIDWLGREDHSDPLQPYLKTKGGIYFNKDFGQIPIDVCGPYCVEDLLTTWEIERYCQEKMRPESNVLWGIEQKLTSILFFIERTGMRIDLQRLYLMGVAAQQTVLGTQDKIYEILSAAGCPQKWIDPAKNSDCYEVLCNHYGLPILSWTDGGKGGKNKEPSFDKYALQDYLSHPRVTEDEKLQQLIENIQTYRHWSTLNNTFFTPYSKLHKDGLLRGDFNQTIRTGRMSMSRPNMQQVPPEVRLLIVPYDQDLSFREKYKRRNESTAGGVLSDEQFTVRDASQIEFRLIVNYCRNKKALAAYQNDPNTDYHQFMADQCAIERKPAKNINFMLSYGGGKYKCLSMLKSALNLLGEYDDTARKQYEADGYCLHVPRVEYKGYVLQEEQNLFGFDAYCWSRAVSVYDKYHRRMPELKKFSRKVQVLMERRGYIINLLGRVRSMPPMFSRKAFNSLIQSSAADLVKERTVAFVDFLTSGEAAAVCKRDGIDCRRCSAGSLLYQGVGSAEGLIKFNCIVHDELDTSEPNDLISCEPLQREIMHILSSPSNIWSQLDVPITWDYSRSGLHWAGCA